MSGVRLRIVPFLIVVALAAFSLRLLDVVNGVSALSGVAYAQEKKSGKAETDAVNLRKDMDDKISAQDGGHEEVGERNSESEYDGEIFEEEQVSKPDEDSDGKPKWRDPIDDELIYSDVNAELLEDLSKRRRLVVQKERQLETREALLEAAERELERKYQEMLQLRNQIEGLLGKQEEEEQAQIASLVIVYEGMKAADAARIFNTLDIDVLVAVVSQMSERKLSPILANMSPERARTITIMLAEKKKLPSLSGAQ